MIQMGGGGKICPYNKFGDLQINREETDARTFLNRQFRYNTLIAWSNTTSSTLV